MEYGIQFREINVVKKFLLFVASYTTICCWKWNLRNPMFKLDMEHHIQEMVFEYVVTTEALSWKTIRGCFLQCGVDDVTTYQSLCIIVQRISMPESPPSHLIKTIKSSSVK